MSKRVFFLLLAANILLFLWEVGRSRESSVPAAADVSLEPLLLLTERKDPS